MFNQIPDYNSYLTYVLTQMPQEDERYRSVAGLILKNNFRTRVDQVAPEVMAYVKGAMLGAIGDGSAMIRSTVGTVIVTICTLMGPEQWPEALMKLMELLDSSTQSEQEVSARISS